MEDDEDDVARKRPAFIDDQSRYAGDTMKCTVIRFSFRGNQTLTHSHENLLLSNGPTAKERRGRARHIRKKAAEGLQSINGHSETASKSFARYFLEWPVSVLTSPKFARGFGISLERLNTMVQYSTFTNLERWIVNHSNTQ